MKRSADMLRAPHGRRVSRRGSFDGLAVEGDTDMGLEVGRIIQLSNR